MPSSYITFVDVNRDRARFYARAKDANFRRTETLSHRFGDLAQQALFLQRKRKFCLPMALLIKFLQFFLQIRYFSFLIEKLTLKTSCSSSPFFCAHSISSLRLTAAAAVMIKLLDLCIAQLTVLTVWSCL